MGFRLFTESCEWDPAGAGLSPGDEVHVCCVGGGGGGGFFSAPLRITNGNNVHFDAIQCSNLRNAYGGSGGDTSFGTLLTARGGTGGGKCIPREAATGKHVKNTVIVPGDVELIGLFNVGDAWTAAVGGYIPGVPFAEHITYPASRARALYYVSGNTSTPTINFSSYATAYQYEGGISTSIYSSGNAVPENFELFPAAWRGWKQPNATTCYATNATVPCCCGNGSWYVTVYTSTSGSTTYYRYYVMPSGCSTDLLGYGVGGAAASLYSYYINFTGYPYINALSNSAAGVVADIACGGNTGEALLRCVRLPAGKVQIAVGGGGSGAILAMSPTLASTYRPTVAATINNGLLVVPGNDGAPGAAGAAVSVQGAALYHRADSSTTTRLSGDITSGAGGYGSTPSGGTVTYDAATLAKLKTWQLYMTTTYQSNTYPIPYQLHYAGGGGASGCVAVWW